MVFFPGLEDDREFPVEIIPHLFLGNAANSEDSQALAKHSITVTQRVPQVPFKNLISIFVSSIFWTWPKIYPTFSSTGATSGTCRSPSMTIGRRIWPVTFRRPLNLLVRFYRCLSVKFPVETIIKLLSKCGGQTCFDNHSVVHTIH